MMDSPLKTCPICFDELEGKETASPDVCDHVFCMLCLQKWTRQATFCPVDRKRFKKIIDLSTSAPIPVKARKRKRQKILYDVSVFCEVCSKSSGGDTLILCDCCDLGYHMSCLTPKLCKIPSGVWHCPVCVAIGEKLKLRKGITKDVEYIARLHTNLNVSPSSSSSESNEGKTCSSQKTSKSESVASSSFSKSIQPERNKCFETTSKGNFSSCYAKRLRTISRKRYSSREVLEANFSKNVRSLRPRPSSRRYKADSDSTSEEDSSSENSPRHRHSDSSSNNEAQIVSKDSDNVESVFGLFTQKVSKKMIVIKTADSDCDVGNTALRKTDSENLWYSVKNDKLNCSHKSIKQIPDLVESVPMDLTNHSKKSNDVVGETMGFDQSCSTLTKCSEVSLDTKIEADLSIVPPCKIENACSLNNLENIPNNTFDSFNNELFESSLLKREERNKEAETDPSNDCMPNKALELVAEVLLLNSSTSEIKCGINVAEKKPQAVTVITEICISSEEEPCFNDLVTKTSNSVSKNALQLSNSELSVDIMFNQNSVSKSTINFPNSSKNAACETSHLSKSEGPSASKNSQEKTLFSVFEKNEDQNSFQNKYSAINQAVSNTTYQRKHSKDLILLSERPVENPCPSTLLKNVNDGAKDKCQKVKEISKELHKLEKEKWKTFHRRSEKTRKRPSNSQHCKKSDKTNAEKYFCQKHWSENYDKLLSITKPLWKKEKWDKFDTVILNNARKKSDFYTNKNCIRRALKSHVSTSNFSSEKFKVKEHQEELISIDQKNFLSLKKREKNLLHTVYCLPTTVNLDMRNDGSVYVKW